ncbi:hydroxysqualene dehydroxylase HpnE [Kaarinaea lacus]
MNKSKPVTIVGGGWAGLTTAVELVRHDIPVILLESAKQLGGRARRVPFENNIKNSDELAGATSTTNGSSGNNDKISVDNGQHLLLGAYDSTLSMLRTVSISEETVLKREKLALNMRRRKGRNVKIKTGRLPAPLHLAWGLLFASGLTFSDRLKALQFCRALLKMDFTIPEDVSCLDLFKRFQQSDTVIKTVWEPLCIAALNTPIETASAVVYLRMLREAFTHAASDSDLLFLRVDLGEAYPDHAVNYIEKYGGNVRLGQRVIDLDIDNKKIKGLKLQESEIKSDFVVLATPQFATRKLLAPHATLSDLTQQITKFETQPIVTVYLQYPKQVKLGNPMIGLVDTCSQWIFDRRLYGQPGLMAVVISSNGPHMELDNNALCAKVEEEIAGFFPAWPKANRRMVIREKRATFDCVTGCNDYRPTNKTSVEGLWLAGDYTDTGLPATLESAVRSGKRCAQSIIKTIHQSGDSS